MNQLIKISRYIGSRFDLVQAGGGNTSVKKDNKLYVKSSGTYLGDMSTLNGITTLDLTLLEAGIDSILNKNHERLTKKELELKSSELLESAIINGGKPSIETFLHACFKKYVIHTHPIAVTLALSSRYIEKIKQCYEEAYVSEYKTPGIELLIGVKDIFKQKNNRDPIVIFLENHGLVVSSDKADLAIEYTNEICDTIAKWLNLEFPIDKESGNIFLQLNELYGNDFLVLPIKNEMSNSYIQTIASYKISAFSPDIFIYLGFEIVNVDGNFQNSIESYKKSYGLMPSIIANKGQLYIIANSYKKAKEIEDVFLCYVQVMMTSYKVNSLPEVELEYLAGWDAEKYRREN